VDVIASFCGCYCFFWRLLLLLFAAVIASFGGYYCFFLRLLLLLVHASPHRDAGNVVDIELQVLTLLSRFKDY